MSANYIIYTLTVVGFFTVYMALLHIFRKDTKRELIKKTAADAFYISDEEKKIPLLASFCHKAVLLTGVDGNKQKDVIAELTRAGLQSPHAVHYYLFFKRIVQPILLILGSIILIKALMGSVAEGSSRTMRMVLGGLLVAIGIFGAKLYITNCRQKRQKKLIRSFPEALDLLLVCIESGLGLDAALTRVCGELHRAHPEFSNELNRTRIELTVMSDRSQALQNLAERTQILPIKALVASLIQTEKFGTSLLETLRVLSEDQRVSRLLNAENRAARIPVLITIPLIFCILPAFIIVILGPPIVRVIEQGGLFGGAAGTR
ncbi:MAG: type II secretion system F family protein [Alphaproteobacteria bacterium]